MSNTREPFVRPQAGVAGESYVIRAVRDLAALRGEAWAIEQKRALEQRPAFTMSAARWAELTGEGAEPAPVAPPATYKITAGPVAVESSSAAGAVVLLAGAAAVAVVANEGQLALRELLRSKK